MYSSGTPRKTKTSTGYLARPKLGALKNIYSARTLTRPTSSYGLDKRKKVRKPSLSKMEQYRKKPDYADTAYREAVSRLRILLAESYIPIKRPLRELDSAGEETDNQSVISAGSRTSRIGHTHYHSPIVPRRYNYYTTPTRSTINVSPEKPLAESQSKWEGGSSTAPPELMSFIERQEEYIEQLEKESRFCRDELSGLLGKVKDVISENENLHEKQKSNLIKSVFDHLETETETETEIELGRNPSKSPRHLRKQRVLEGPSIVFESRISELEAQLTQTKIDLKKALDENESLKRKMADGVIGEGFDSVKKQLENLSREKAVLQETVTKLQSSLSLLRDKENNTSDQVKRSLDVAEQAQYEKTAAEHEIRRLKDELERQHGKLRDAINEQSRRVADERSAVERRYTQQIEQLTTELGVQWEQTNKLQLELDKQRRENGDLRRDIAQKQAQIDELKKDMQNKIISLQSDIGLSGAEKSALEQQIATLQLANERQERQARQEASRQQAEMQSLRQRLDRADADLIHSRRENIRLSEQVAALEKELKMNEALADERSKRSSGGGGEVIALPPPKEDREKELSSMIKNMETKHVATVAELEGMIYSQNQLMDKLSNECHALAQKLEEASTRHKEEIRELQTNLDYLTSRFTLPSKASSNEDEGHSVTNSPGPAPIKSPIRREISEPVRTPNRELSRTSSNASFKPTMLPRQAEFKINESSFETPKPSSQDIRESAKELPVESRQPTPELRKSDRQQYDQQYSAKPSQQYTKIPNQQYEAKPSQRHSEDPVQNSENFDREHTEHPDEHYMKQSQQEYPNELSQRYIEDPDNEYSVDPNQQYSDPDQRYSSPNQQYSDPNQQYTDRNRQYTDPDQQYTDPNQQYTDPNQQYTDPNQQYTDPNQQYTDPNQQYTAPNQQYTNEPYEQQYMTQEEYNQQYGQRDDPNVQYEVDPNQEYSADQQFTAEDYEMDQQYATDQQYTSNPQYATDQQHSSDQQYPTQQQFTKNQYPTNPKFSPGQQYSSSPRYPSGQQFTSDQQQYATGQHQYTSGQQQSVPLQQSAAPKHQEQSPNKPAVTSEQKVPPTADKEYSIQQQPKPTERVNPISPSKSDISRS